MKYLWPYISEGLSRELYQKSYFTGISEDDEGFEVPRSRSDYESEFAAPRVEKFGTTIDELLEYAPHARSVLDIGAATGEFLASAKARGLAPAGIEISAYAAAKAREKYGFSFHQTGLNEYEGKEQYDLIHMNHVFEHFQAPNEALSRVSALLSPAGAVYVEVPDQFSLVEVVKFRMTGARKAFDVFSIHHPVFYSPRTLRNVFEKNGFECQTMRVFRWSRYPVRGAVGHLKRLVWMAASVFGQGLYIEAIFTKKN